MLGAAVVALLFTVQAHALEPGFFVETLFDSSDFVHPDPPEPTQRRPSITTVKTFPDGRVFIGTGDLRGYFWDPATDVDGGGNAVLPVFFLDYRGRPASEFGIVGCAPAPDYLTSGTFFLTYTKELSDTERVIRVERFTADLSDLHAIVPEADPVNGGDLGRVIFEISDENHFTEFHFGGGTTFGSDGKLYVSFGDDAGTNNPQSLTSYRGKVHRMNPDGSAPTDNPFYVAGNTTARNYIYSRGFRNPFRTIYDPVYDRLITTDTGQSLWEEVNVIGSGSNHGWPEIEGPIADNPGVNPPEGYRDPFFAYKHGKAELQGYSIVSACVYDGTMFPAEYYGDLFVSDWGTFVDGGSPGEIFRLRTGAEGQLLETTSFFKQENNGFGMADMTVLSDGSLMMAITGNTVGQVRRISYEEPDAAPAVELSADVTSGQLPLAVNFSATIIDEASPAIAWDFGGLSIATGSTNRSFTFNQPGLYDVSVTVTDAYNSTAIDTVTVRVWQNVDELALAGTLYDATALSPSPIAGTIELYESDGMTPLPPAPGIPIDVPREGVFAVLLTDLTAAGDYIVGLASAPGMVPRSFVIPITQSEGSFQGSIYLAQTAITGRVTDSQSGGPIAGLDVWLETQDLLGFTAPYEVFGGFDFAAPNEPVGYPWGDASDTRGRFYFPVRSSDEHQRFLVSANRQENSGGEVQFPDAVVFSQDTQVTSGEAASVELRLAYISGGDGCDAAVPADWYNPSFAEIQNIFDTHCLGCHAHVNPYMGLDLEDGFAFSSLVNQRSKENSNLYLAEQRAAGYGASDNQYLLEKVACDVPSLGGVMPPFGKISGKELRDIAQWLRNGARPGPTRISSWASRTSATSPAIIRFRGGAEAANPPFTFAWDFANGAMGSGISPAAAYVVTEGSEEFTVEMEVKDKNGSSVGTKLFTLTVTAPTSNTENIAPAAALEVTSLDTVIRTATYDASGSIDADGSVIAYQWDFENNGTIDQTTLAPATTHTFASDGVYHTRLIVVDDKNATDATTVEIRLNTEPAEGWKVY